MRIQIGSLAEKAKKSELRPKPPAQVPPEKKSSYPPPRLSKVLPPEMEQELEQAMGGMSLEDLYAGSTSQAVGEPLEPETCVTPRVISVRNEEVFVDLGGNRQGVVPLRQFDETPVAGATLDLVVIRFDPEDGLYELARPGAAAEVGDWSDVAEGMIVQATVTGHNKGGLECQVSGLRGFMPAGQVSLYHVEDLESCVGQSFTCLVTEANPERRNLVLSRRAVLEREKVEAKEKLLEELAVGQTREGIVRSLKDFGAFVDLGGLDGLIHISQLSWDRVAHPSDVLAVGQKVRVRIEKFDRETGKLSLSYRELSDSPWATAEAKYPVGKRVRGTVSKIVEFGAFVKLEPGVEGLVHLSELSPRHVRRASEVVSEGESVEVQVLAVDAAAQRISLSLKALAGEVPADQDEDEGAGEEPESMPPARKKSNKPLQGGLKRDTGGEQFGLKW